MVGPCFASPTVLSTHPRPVPAQQTCSLRMSVSAPDRVRVAILGASGYTGVELLRLLRSHPHADITALTAERSAGKGMGDVFPQFSFGRSPGTLPTLVKHEDVDDWAAMADIVFCCLPHATTQEIISGLPLDSGLRVVDLSADFRLSDTELYKEWYGGEHLAKDLQAEAVYGLCEINREKVKGARLVANPGCYPTAAQLPLIPLLRKGLISPQDIIIDAKSGATGAGRAAKVGTLFCEVTDGVSAYGIASHRHAPEIEQGLGEALGGDAPMVAFTPHLMPMSRGILETIYVKTEGGVTADGLREELERQYGDEPFVHVLPKGAPSPQTRHVRGSNHCVMSVVDDRISGRAIIVSVIDNVVKGASGQAIQNMNILLGYPEETGLEQVPVFP